MFHPASTRMFDCGLMLNQSIICGRFWRVQVLCGTYSCSFNRRQTMIEQSTHIFLSGHAIEPYTSHQDTNECHRHLIRIVHCERLCVSRRNIHSRIHSISSRKYWMSSNIACVMDNRKPVFIATTTDTTLPNKHKKYINSRKKPTESERLLRRKRAQKKCFINTLNRCFSVFVSHSQVARSITLYARRKQHFLNFDEAIAIRCVQWFTMAKIAMIHTLARWCIHSIGICCCCFFNSIFASGVRWLSKSIHYYMYRKSFSMTAADLVHSPHLVI